MESRDPSACASTSAPSASSPAKTPARRLSAVRDRYRPAQPVGAGQPGAPHRPETLRLPVLPAPGERREEQRQRVGRCQRRGAGFDQAGRGNGSRDAGVAGEVHADPEHHPVHAPACAERRFQQDAGDLGAVHEDVVGPLAARPAGQRPVHQVHHRKRGDEGELRHMARLAGGAEDDRKIEVARRRDPRPSPPAAPGALPARPHHRAVGRAVCGALLRLVVGAAGLVEGDHGVALRQHRLRQGSSGRGQGTSAAAAASAPARIGPG